MASKVCHLVTPRWGVSCNTRGALASDGTDDYRQTTCQKCKRTLRFTRTREDTICKESLEAFRARRAAHEADMFYI